MKELKKIIYVPEYKESCNCAIHPRLWSVSYSFSITSIFGTKKFREKVLGYTTYITKELEIQIKVVLEFILEFDSQFRLLEKKEKWK